MLEFLALILFALAVWLIPHYCRKWRRHYLRSRPLTREQQQLLYESLALYRFLPQDLQSELRANISLFLRTKEFVGCNSLEVTEHMRVAVAAHACLLLLGRANRCYPSLYTVLMYPDTFVVRETYTDDSYIETTEHSSREGEAHYRGPVVLSWADFTHDMQHPEQGRNLALHEFAHKLDEEDGYYDGRPQFDGAAGGNWARVLSEEYDKLREWRDRAEQEEKEGPGENTEPDYEEREKALPLLDIYGAESPAEFFAVITETFFTVPDEMAAEHPQLYRELCQLYRLDPAALQSGNPVAGRYPSQ